MEAHSIIWAPAARDDAVQIWQRYADIASTDVADRVLEQLTHLASVIAENPRAWRERPELMVGIHVARSQPYLLFYRLNHNRPEIVRVLHERRDSRSLLDHDKK